MKLELEKVAGTVVSAVVTAMVIGAAAIVWRGATTVDAKVNQAVPMICLCRPHRSQKPWTC